MQQQEEEEENQVYKCEFPDCEKRFTTKFSLKRHYYIHSRLKTFKCQYCPKQFALPQYLREHQYTHTNQQPFICGVDGCEETFRQRGKLSLHRRTHEGFKKKDYRLLNSEINLKKRRRSSEKQDKIQKNDSFDIKNSSIHSQCDDAKLLYDNWSPMKRQKVDNQTSQQKQMETYKSNENTLAFNLHVNDDPNHLFNEELRKDLDDQEGIKEEESKQEEIMISPIQSPQKKVINNEKNSISSEQQSVQGKIEKKNIQNGMFEKYSNSQLNKPINIASFHQQIPVLPFTSYSRVPIINGMHCPQFSFSAMNPVVPQQPYINHINNQYLNQNTLKQSGHLNINPAYNNVMNQQQLNPMIIGHPYVQALNQIDLLTQQLIQAQQLNNFRAHQIFPAKTASPHNILMFNPHSMILQSYNNTPQNQINSHQQEKDSQHNQQNQSQQ